MNSRSGVEADIARPDSPSTSDRPPVQDRGFGARWRSLDPWVFVVGAVSLVTYALHGVNGTLTRDLGVYSYAGQQVADGLPPYVGILNRAGPLAHVIPAIGVFIARVGGFDDIVSMRVLFMLIATICVCAVYLLGRDLFASRLAGLVTAGTFLSFYGFIQYAADGPREKTPMTLFVVCALWAVTRRRWFTAGVFVSLATLCLQISFFASFAAVVAGAVLLARGRRVRALLRVALGGAVPVLICVVWFALLGSLRVSIDAFYVINARYTTPNPVLGELGKVWLDAWTAYGVTLVLLVGGLIWLLVRGFSARHQSVRRQDPSVLVLAAFAVATIVGLLWNLRDYDAWPDLFPVLPLAAVGVGAAFTTLARRVSARTALSVAVVWALVTTALAVGYSVSSRKDTLLTQRADVAAVMKVLPANATITSIEAPQPLVLTKRKNPTRHQMFRAGLQNYVQDTWPGGLAGFRRTLVARRPTVISVGFTTYPEWRAAIKPEYVYVGHSVDWLWYARRSLGPAKLAELRRATGYHPS